MHLTTTLLATLTSLLPLTTAFSNPMTCTGECHDTHDPSLIRRGSNGTYFRFSTGGGIDIHTAPSLTGAWSSAGTVLPSGSSIDNAGSDDCWAPDVHRVDGTYYLYYAVSSFGTEDSAIGVATSDTMESGTWTDHGGIGISSSAGDAYNAIDPNLITADGVSYMTYGSFYGDIAQTTLSGDALSASGDTPYTIEFNSTGSRPSEGSYVYAYGDYYYLFFSSGSCCGYDTDRPAPGDEYKIMVCRSESVDGDYVDENGTACTDNGGTLVLGSHGVVYGPGGQGVYNDPTYGPVLYYHYVNTTIGYSDADKVLGINTIDFSSGWPVV